MQCNGNVQLTITTLSTIMAEVGCNGARRKLLSMAIGALLSELGYDSVDKMALETLTEMAQSFITEAGASSRAYCELAGRVEPLLGDVVMSFIEMGFSMDGIERHAWRNNRSVLPSLSMANQPKQLAILQAGQKLPHPAHIPPHLPSFPDPHAYIRTPTHKQPVTEYEALREKAAVQKRDVERALTRFVAKTGDTHSLFQTDDTNVYPIIACKPQIHPYLDALMPRDQIFDQEEEELEQQQQQRVARRPRRDDLSQQSGTLDDTSCDKSLSPPSSPLPRTPSPSPSPLKQSPEPPTQARNSSDTMSDVDIDNPYLRPVKVPRKSKG